MKSILKLATITFLIITLVIILRNITSKKVITETILAMGTTARITIVVDHPTRNKIDRDYKMIDEAFSLLKKYDQTLSFYSQDSELKAINKNAGQAPVKISDLMLDILEKSLFYSKFTGGVFDVTATSLQKEGGYGSIILNTKRKTVYFKNKKTKIDLGGIATGFAVDKIAEHFEQFQIENYLIDIGGDIYAHGVNEHGVTWKVGVRNPISPEKIVKKVSIKNQAVTTSGNYVKKHIIDPKSGSLADEGLLSVSVIAPTCVDADVFATAFFIMGMPRAKALILRHRNDIKALFVISNQGRPEAIVYNWNQ